MEATGEKSPVPQELSSKQTCFEFGMGCLVSSEHLSKDELLLYHLVGVL